MSDAILFERVLPHGPVVRIRRTSAPGELPVVGVLEVDRRAGTPRDGLGMPPSLMRVEGASDQEVMAALEPHARDDRTVAGLLRERGLR